MPAESIFAAYLAREAARRGVTIETILDEERERARGKAASEMSDICTGVLGYAEDLIECGVRVRSINPPCVDVPELPSHLASHGEHLHSCEWCQAFIAQKSSSK